MRDSNSPESPESFLLPINTLALRHPSVDMIIITWHSIAFPHFLQFPFKNFINKQLRSPWHLVAFPHTIFVLLTSMYSHSPTIEQFYYEHGKAYFSI